MKSISGHNSSNDNNTSSNSISNANNSNNDSWLGFSLSPHMKMEAADTSSAPHHHHHHHHHDNDDDDAAATGFFLTPHLFNTSAGLCYGFADNTAAVVGGSDFHHPMSVMPLKSDGSLCFMEAAFGPSPSHPHPGIVVPGHSSTSPKLEDFLGCSSMGGPHHYGGHDQREAMVLSLDSMFYQHSPPPPQPADDSSDLLHHHQSYFSGIGCQDIYQHAPPLGEVDTGKGEEAAAAHHLAECDAQIASMSDFHALGQHVGSGTCGMGEDAGAGSPGSAMGCGDLQSLTLSMSPGSQSSCVTVAPASTQIPGAAAGSEGTVDAARKRGASKMVGPKQPVHRKSIDTFGQRTSQYRGVTRHRWTGRYEAHLWDNSCKKEGQTRKGRQVYLGGYDMEEKAARAYDLAALKYWGASTHINFPLDNYREELEEMKKMSRQEYVAHLRRKSSGFSRGASVYRGVTRHHQHGRWQARIGRVAGNKDLYLGTFGTQEEAAEAYDIAAIKFRGVNAVTNFDITRYDVARIITSNSLLSGEHARRHKDIIIEPSEVGLGGGCNNGSSQNTKELIGMNMNQSESTTNNGSNLPDWKMSLYQEQQPLAAACSGESADDDHYKKSPSIGNYHRSSPSFPLALQDLIVLDSTSPSQQIANDESAKLGTHFSNSSSLVTSLSSSREASPDKSRPSAGLLAAPPFSSWIPNAASQLRPAAAISVAHFPVYAAWNET